MNKKHMPLFWFFILLFCWLALLFMFAWFGGRAHGAAYVGESEALFSLRETLPADKHITTFRGPVEFLLLTDFSTASWQFGFKIERDDLKVSGFVNTGHTVLERILPGTPEAKYNLTGFSSWKYKGQQFDRQDLTAASATERTYNIGGDGFFARLGHGMPLNPPHWSANAVSLGSIEIAPQHTLSLGILGFYGYTDLPALRPGDFNHDGKVDTKDYVLYRNGNGVLAPFLMKENVWRFNYGNDALPIKPTTVPEPRTIFQILLILILLCQTGRERIRDYYRNQSGRTVPIPTIAEVEEIYKHIRTKEQLADAVHRHREWWLKRLYKMWLQAKKGKGPRAGAPDNVVGSPGYLARMWREQILAWNHPTEPNTLYLSFYPDRYTELKKKLQRHELAAYDKLRVWNLKDGTKVRAVLGLIEPQAVILLQVDGHVNTVRRSKLSNEDKKYVLTQYRNYIQNERPRAK